LGKLHSPPTTSSSPLLSSMERSGRTGNISVMVYRPASCSAGALLLLLVFVGHEEESAIFRRLQTRLSTSSLFNAAEAGEQSILVSRSSRSASSAAGNGKDMESRLLGWLFIESRSDRIAMFVLFIKGYYCELASRSESCIPVGSS